MQTRFWPENLEGRDHSEDSIRMDLMEIGWEGVDWMHLAVVNMVMNFGFHKSGKFC
jgi:hypothetical protein